MSSTEPLPAFDSETKPRYTESPNPGFAYGRKVEDTPEGKKWLEGHKEGWKTIETASEDPAYYAMMISGIVPRPIAFVSSISSEGVENLAPFRQVPAWFNQVTHNPPIISVSCSASPKGGLKDTASNIKATKNFTVNIISEPFVENANFTSLDAPADVSEWPECIPMRTSKSGIHGPGRSREKVSSLAQLCDDGQRRSAHTVSVSRIPNPKSRISSSNGIYQRTRTIIMSESDRAIPSPNAGPQPQSTRYMLFDTKRRGPGVYSGSFRPSYTVPEKDVHHSCKSESRECSYEPE
ncbi:hypothetical protein C8Q70DRAFT_927387 [Cubamyces menziesii]|nr:hypothetical protein C8Q70DRAFT_927387 [Cubamyces menziesii]